MQLSPQLQSPWEKPQVLPQQPEVLQAAPGQRGGAARRGADGHQPVTEGAAFASPQAPPDIAGSPQSSAHLQTLAHSHLTAQEDMLGGFLGGV